MRDLVTVIDEMFAVIPKNGSTQYLRRKLNSIKSRIGYLPPENTMFLWAEGGDVLFTAFEGLDPIDLTGWERMVVDIWMGKNLNKGEQ